MKKNLVFILLQFVFLGQISAQNIKAHNPVMHADVPDLSMIRVGDTYYMSGTHYAHEPRLAHYEFKGFNQLEIRKLRLQHLS